MISDNLTFNENMKMKQPTMVIIVVIRVGKPSAIIGRIVSISLV